MAFRRCKYQGPGRAAAKRDIYRPSDQQSVSTARGYRTNGHLEYLDETADVQTESDDSIEPD